MRLYIEQNHTSDQNRGANSMHQCYLLENQIVGRQEKKEKESDCDRNKYAKVITDQSDIGSVLDEKYSSCDSRTIFLEGT